MTRCKPGDVVLVRFPLADTAANKKRPAIVLSPGAYSDRHGDVVVLALTGQNPGDGRLALCDWREAGLLKPTWVKPLIATVNSSVIDRRLGQLTPDDRKTAAKALSLMIDRMFSE